MPPAAAPTSATLDLGPTPTYARRTADWVGDGPGEGILTLTLRRRAASPPEADVYRVEEQPAAGRLGRVFLLLNVFDADQPDVYEAAAAPPGHGGCTCPAGRAGRAACKHQAALQALVAGGHL